MPKLGEMFPSRFLKASDFDDGEQVLTIKGLEQEEVGQGRDKEDKWVIFFEESEKGLILNKTNTNTLAKLYGDDTDHWEGKRVTLFSTEVQFKDDMVAAVRIRSKAPKQDRKPGVPLVAEPIKGKGVPAGKMADPPDDDPDDTPF